MLSPRADPHMRMGEPPSPRREDAQDSRVTWGRVPFNLVDERHQRYTINNLSPLALSPGGAEQPDP